MDEEYDFIVLGTGLKECILSGLLSTNGYKILHMDKNSYYGAESASLSLDELRKKYYGKDKAPEDLKLGRSRNYCVDLCPKLILATGNLVKILLATQVTKYLDFRSIAGSYVYNKGGTFSGAGLYKVPSTGGEAMKSTLVGLLSKYNFGQFVAFCANFDYNDQKTWPNKMDVKKTPMTKIYSYYKLSDTVQEFVGHAVCLYLDDSYKPKAAYETIERAKLYLMSVQRYGNSPYIYPRYGLGGLPEGFSRLCAVHGGTYMLGKPIYSIEKKDGKVIGVNSEDENGVKKLAKCKKGVLADPTYFVKEEKAGPEIKRVGSVARWIVILDQPLKGTNNADSCQVIIPASQVPGRKQDIYVSMVSYTHMIAQQGFYIAVIQANVENTDESKAKKELAVAYSLFKNQKPRAEFFSVCPEYTSTIDMEKEQLFITKSYDATSHWETTCQEVIEIYKKMTGKDVDLTIDTNKLGQEE